MAVAAQGGRNWRWLEIKSDLKHLRLLAGIKHQRGLKWRVINLAANWDCEDGIRPIDVRSSAKSPHSAILWAAAYFPAWVAAMDGVNVAGVWIPGYEIRESDGRAWSLVPFLFFDRDAREVVLNADSRGDSDRDCAVPEFRE